MVESAPVAGPQGPSLRDVGSGLPSGCCRHSLLEQASAPLHLGAPSPPSGAPQAGHRTACPPRQCGLDLPDAPLSGASGKSLIHLATESPLANATAGRLALDNDTRRTCRMHHLAWLSRAFGE